VSDIAEETAHLYLWVPNALLPDGLAAMQAWGFTYNVQATPGVAKLGPRN
jgi:N6-adenosine-specific RNA methylase IME4